MCGSLGAFCARLLVEASGSVLGKQKRRRPRARTWVQRQCCSSPYVGRRRVILIDHHLMFSIQAACQLTGSLKTLYLQSVRRGTTPWSSSVGACAAASNCSGAQNLCIATSGPI